MLSRRIAGDTVAAMTIWLCWALLVPVVAGSVPSTKPVMNTICPHPVMRQGVGSNLKTYQRPVDLCQE